MHTQYRKKNDNNNEGGFVLILAMLVISVILSISLSIVTITIKEIKLGGYMRESEKAFIAADRALECAMFWDRAVQPESTVGLQFTPFATSTLWVAPPNINNARCYTDEGANATFVQLNNAGQTLWTVSGVTATEGRTSYQINYVNGTSAEVVVQKNGINTTITSSGYNTSNVTNPRRTQRTIVAVYNL